VARGRSSYLRKKGGRSTEGRLVSIKFREEGAGSSIEGGGACPRLLWQRKELSNRVLFDDLSLFLGREGGGGLSPLRRKGKDSYSKVTLYPKEMFWEEAIYFVRAILTHHPIEGGGRKKSRYKKNNPLVRGGRGKSAISKQKRKR